MFVKPGEDAICKFVKSSLCFLYVSLLWNPTKMQTRPQTYEQACYAAISFGNCLCVSVDSISVSIVCCISIVCSICVYFIHFNCLFYFYCPFYFYWQLYSLFVLSALFSAHCSFEKHCNGNNHEKVYIGNCYLYIPKYIVRVYIKTPSIINLTSVQVLKSEKISIIHPERLQIHVDQ